MLVQFQFQYLSIIKLKLELSAIEARIVLVDDAVVIRTYDNDIGRVVVLRTSEIVNMMCLNNAVAIFVANSLATYLIAIVIELLSVRMMLRSILRYFTNCCFSSIEAYLSAMKNLSSSLCSYISSGTALRLFATC